MSFFWDEYNLLHCIFILLINIYLHITQERALALAENRPLPALHSSVDVRPLCMDDFKFAHEQVGHLQQRFL